MSRRRWPRWWDWDLEFTPHAYKRMLDRRISEVDLRLMLEEATGFREDLVADRLVIETTQKKRAWEVIVEPDGATQRLVVVTAYPVFED